MTNLAKRLILLELNEINFDVVGKYVAADPARFPALKKLLSCPSIRTSCEKRYEELEPWIQWASVHTGKTYAEHGVFRLGDMVGTQVPQIFEQLESAGLKVGAISAMNAENRLKRPAYFIPDPWTQTLADSSWWSQALGQAVSQAVNDNAQARITNKLALQVVLGLLRFARVAHYQKYLSLVLRCRSKPWLKALVLDLLLHDVHWSMFNAKKPNFSTLFLNAGAHIQHHYFFNAAPLRKESPNRNPTWYVPENADPLADVLGLYDLIVGEYFERNDTDVLLATGLSQKPYDRVKFYYRLNTHADFLRGLGIVFSGVFPRMTGDFLIEFENAQQALAAQDVLAGVRVLSCDEPLFGEIENRGKSLFVILTFPQEITAETQYQVGDRKAALLPEVSFVAIKNGMHQEEGFAFFTEGAARYAPIDQSHVAQLGATIMSYFGVNGRAQAGLNAQLLLALAVDEFG
ncbi:MAG: hypothetical protein FJY26_10625 [Betaproteobacteria bacterium]|nr:hypothetical protein [Betaproteobacteria bacterium]